MRLPQLIEQVTTIQGELSAVCDSADDTGSHLLRLATFAKQVVKHASRLEELVDDVHDKIDNLSSETAIERWETVLLAMEALQDACSVCYDELENLMERKSLPPAERWEEAVSLANEFRDQADGCLSDLESV